jgi:hypothetical protein
MAGAVGRVASEEARVSLPCHNVCLAPALNDATRDAHAMRRSPTNAPQRAGAAQWNVAIRRPAVK